MKARAAAASPQTAQRAPRQRIAPVAIPMPAALAGAMTSSAGLEHEAHAAAERATGLATRSSTATPWNRLTAGLAPRIAARAVASPGRGLDPALRRAMQTELNADFSAVRVHTDPIAERAAHALSARAFAYGPHLAFAAGQYAPHRPEGRRLIAHELTHCRQRQGASAQLVLRDAVDDVREKLSYRFTDWAIRDGEAIDSLNLLAALSDEELKAGLNRLGAKYIDRLLDNLPDSAKAGPGYQRVLAAIGQARALGYATDLLEYGVFDWAITDADAGRVLNVFANLPEAEREAFLLGLERAGRLGRLFDNATAEHYAQHILPWVRSLTRGGLSGDQRDILRRLVENAPDDPIEILQTATEVRYDVAVGPSTIPDLAPAPWNAKRLRATYLALNELPDAHVAHNRELTRFGQFSVGQSSGTGANSNSLVIVSGTYDSSVRELGVNAQDFVLPAQRGADGQMRPPVKVESDLTGTLIHETAHAVDAEMGWSTGPEPAKPARGGWKSYPDHHSCATEMVADSADAIANQLDGPQRTAVIGNMTASMGRGQVSSLESEIRANAWFSGLDESKRKAVLADPALDALRIGIATGADAPWFAAKDGGRHLGPHVYQQSYAHDWVRYRHEARSRMVSDSGYQFRDPAEWFAECYAAYYRPDPRGRGARLAAKDPDTKLYFDQHVHTRPNSR